MRHLEILKLHLEHMLEHRSRSFVWFIMSMINPLLLIFFWKGAFHDQSTNANWQISEIQTYYLLIIVATSLLVAHVEEGIAYDDINKGGLSRYLTRPISYYWIKFHEEIPFRLLQGFYGTIAFIILFILFNLSFVWPEAQSLILTICITIAAYFLIFTYKMILGLIAIWTTEFSGIFQLFDVVFWVMGGLLMPLTIYPNLIQKMTYLLPFTYMIYIPIASFQSQFNTQQQLSFLLIQALWLIVAICIYKIMWIRGLKKFSGVGQ